MTTDNFNPPNSIWPNGLKRDEEGYVTFYPTGTNKVDISTITWPVGDKLVSPFVYQNGELVGFVDTKALTVSGSATTTMNYNHIEADFASISEGKLTVNAPNATVKKFSWAISTSGDESFDFVIIDFNTTDQETINTVRTAKRVVDNKLYDADDNLIGTWDTSKIEVGGIYDPQAMNLDGLFCNIDATTMGQRDLIISEFNSNLSSLSDGSSMFAYCPLASFSSNLSSLTDGIWMFSSCPLTSFSSALPSLTNGEGMFAFCENLISFSSNLSNLTYGGWMFEDCYQLESFNSDLSSLTRGDGMFARCESLTSFNGNLPSLTNGWFMFENCKLDTASVQNIADTIKDVTSLTGSSSSEDEVYKIIVIGIGNSEPNEQEKEAFNQMVSKGWTVYVNGHYETDIWNPTSITPIDGEETVTPIPFWAKPVQTDEKHAKYIDSEGNFFDILGGQFIYGDDISTYGMFTCEEDAATQMRLTKIEKPQRFALKP